MKEDKPNLSSSGRGINPRSFGCEAKALSLSYQTMRGGDLIKKVKEKKDLRVIISDDLSPKKHVNKITAENLNLLSNTMVPITNID